MLSYNKPSGVYRIFFLEIIGGKTVKKILSVILAGAVMLSLSACVSNAGSNGPDESIEEIQSESEVAEEETSETAVVETSETSDETTIEPSDETGVVSSDESVAYPGEAVVAESESGETKVSEPSVAAFADDKTSGKIFINFNKSNYNDIPANVRKIVSLDSTLTPDEFAGRFSTKPKYSYKNGVWTFEWEGNKDSKNTYRLITIKAKNVDNKIVLDKDSRISVSMLFEDHDMAQNVMNRLCETFNEATPYDILKGGLKIDPDYCDNYEAIVEDEFTGYGATEVLVECSLPNWVKEGRTFDG